MKRVACTVLVSFAAAEAKGRADSDGQRRWTVHSPYSFHGLHPSLSDPGPEVSVMLSPGLPVFATRSLAGSRPDPHDSSPQRSKQCGRCRCAMANVLSANERRPIQGGRVSKGHLKMEETMGRTLEVKSGPTATHCLSSNPFRGEFVLLPRVLVRRRGQEHRTCRGTLSSGAPRVGGVIGIFLFFTRRRITPPPNPLALCQSPPPQPGPTPLLPFPVGQN